MCLLIALNVPGPFMLYFPLLLLGAAFSRIKITASTVQLIGVALHMAWHDRRSPGDCPQRHARRTVIFSEPVLLNAHRGAPIEFAD